MTIRCHYVSIEFINGCIIKMDDSRLTKEMFNLINLKEIKKLVVLIRE